MDSEVALNRTVDLSIARVAPVPVPVWAFVWYEVRPTYTRSIEVPTSVGPYLFPTYPFPYSPSPSLFCASASSSERPRLPSKRWPWSRQNGPGERLDMEVSGRASLYHLIPHLPSCAANLRFSAALTTNLIVASREKHRLIQCGV